VTGVRHRNDVLDPADVVAAFDSASAFLDALARALRQESFPRLGQARWKVPLVLAGQLLPGGLRRRAYATFSGREGIAPDRLGEVDMAAVAQWVVSHYSRPAGGRFPGVLLGSSNGALTHLAASCGLPWLPQTLLIPVRRPGSDPEDYAAAARFGERHGNGLLHDNPDITLHHMHDPVQDRLSASEMAYFRVKWRSLPTAYEHFLARTLEPGAPIVLVRDSSSWPVTRVSERHVFQAGARGGLDANDYTDLPGVPRPDDVSPEAEWGWQENLGHSVRSWAEDHGHPVVEVTFDGPQAPSAAVADTIRAWVQGRGLAGQRLVVSSFVVLDPWRTITTGSVPYWTFFPVAEAARDLCSYLDATSYEDIAVMLFNHGVRSAGLVDAEQWQQVAARARRSGRLLGVRAGAFPADFGAFARYERCLRRLGETEPPAHPLGLHTALRGLGGSSRLNVTWPGS
jgi:hypothetical protein